MSAQRWSVVSAAAVLACAGTQALAGGFTHISVNSGGRGGLSIGGSYSSGWSGNNYRGFRNDCNDFRGHYNSCYPRSSFYVGFPIYSRPYYYEPVVYPPPVIVVQSPVVYTQPVTYPTQPVVYTQPTTYRHADYPQAPIVTEPVVNRRVVVEETAPVIEETVVVKKAPQIIKKVTAVEDTSRRVLSAYEAGLRAIQDRKPGDAIDQLNEHLRVNPNDTRALRLTAVMYAEQNNCAEAARRVIEAYKADSNLPNQPVDAASLGIGPGRLRDISNNAERYAMKLHTGSAYLMTSVLMQAEGRTADAIAMADLATNAGLEPGIAANLSAALR